MGTVKGLGKKGRTGKFGKISLILKKSFLHGTQTNNCFDARPISLYIIIFKSSTCFQNSANFK